MVTHAHRAAAALCDRVVLMKEGLLWAAGDPDALLREEVLDRLYESDAAFERFDA
jgi:ABC-type hemin transport system ATPase subunit